VAVLSSFRYIRTRIRRGRTGQRVRLSAVITANLGGVFNLTRPGVGSYARASERLGSPYFAWSPYGTPPFEHDTSVAAGCSEPRFCWDETTSRILLVCNNDGTIEERASDDDGYTWNAAEDRFTGAAHPDIAAAPSGLILRACYAAGALKLTRRNPGDTAPGAAFPAKNALGVDLSIRDDSFRIVAAPNGLWWLHVRLAGDPATVLLYSGDDGATWSTTSGSVTGISGGTHPGICVDTAGGLVAWACVAGKGHLTRRHPGDENWSTPLVMRNDAAADLAFVDQPFSITPGVEGAARLILAAVLSGETLPSEHGSADFGATWQRLAP